MRQIKLTITYVQELYIQAKERLQLNYFIKAAEGDENFFKSLPGDKLKEVINLKLYDDKATPENDFFVILQAYTKDAVEHFILKHSQWIDRYGNEKSAVGAIIYQMLTKPGEFSSHYPEWEDKKLLQIYIEIAGLLTPLPEYSQDEFIQEDVFFDAWESTPMLIAARNKKFDLVKWFLDCESNATNKDMGNKSLIHVLAQIGSLEMLQYALEKITDEDQRIEELESVSDNQYTPLTYAILSHSATDDRFPMIKLFVEEYKVDVDAREAVECSLELCILQEEGDLFNYLLNQGADLTSLEDSLWLEDVNLFKAPTENIINRICKEEVKYQQTQKSSKVTELIWNNIMLKTIYAGKIKDKEEEYSIRRLIKHNPTLRIKSIETYSKVAGKSELSTTTFYGNAFQIANQLHCEKIFMTDAELMLDELFSDSTPLSLIKNVLLNASPFPKVIYQDGVPVETAKKMTELLKRFLQIQPNEFTSEHVNSIENTLERLTQFEERSRNTNRIDLKSMQLQTEDEQQKLLNFIEDFEAILTRFEGKNANNPMRFSWTPSNQEPTVGFFGKRKAEEQLEKGDDKRQKTETEADLFASVATPSFSPNPVRQ